jgi:hypothetical protein
MQDVANFARTMNMATQAVAKANADMANTGTGAAVLNGVPIASLTQDAALDISADRQHEAWVTATAYTAAGGARTDIRFVTDDNGKNQMYVCILAHTSSADNKPGQSDHINATWRTYWTPSTSNCVAARGLACANLKTRRYLCLADAQGVMTTVVADNGLQLDADSILQIPSFEAEIFIALAILVIDGTGASTWGTTDDNAQVTVTQIVGPAFASGLGIDKN